MAVEKTHRDSHSCSLRVVSEIFRTRVLHTQAQAANSAPVCPAGDLALAHIANRDVFLVAALRNNANVMMALQWLDAVCTAQHCASAACTPALPRHLLASELPCRWPKVCNTTAHVYINLAC